ncbi:MAG TPA: hypothetical protein VGM37_09825 [Armatimonadota bacterium]|jgi:hypothetical protein
MRRAALSIALALAASALAQGLPYTPPGNDAAFRGGLVHYEEGARHWIASDGVEIRYREYVLKADSGDYDVDAQIATLRGGVSLDTGRNIIVGGDDAVLTFHFPDRKWTFTNAITDIQPQGLTEPVHVRAESLAGTRTELTLHRVRLTTCAPGQPQYEVSARDVTVEPDKRIVARHATTTLFGRRLATVAALVLPIRRETADRPPVVPTFGQSTEEGFFVKTNLNYAGANRQSGAVRLDVMQKQGLGIGVTHDYREGEASVYQVLGKGGGNLSANLRHAQRLLGFDAALNGELRRNSYLYLPGSSSRNATLALNRARQASNTGLSFRWDATKSGATNYGGFTAGLAQGYRYSAKGNATVGLDYTRRSAAAVSTKELASKVDVAQGFSAVDVEVAANHLSTLAGEASVYKPVERLPELSLKSDVHRLGLAATKSAPITLQLATGAFEANGVKSGRQLFEATAPNRVWTLGGAKLNLGGGFRQAIYSSQSALYSLTGAIGVTQPIGHSSDVNLSWAVQAPRGYTPFIFDRPYAYNTLTSSVKVGAVHWLELRAGAGYDFKNNITPWRDVMGFLKIEPRDGIRLITDVAVNVNGLGPGEASHFRYVNNALRLRLGRFHFDGESRYLPATRNFGRILGNLDTPIGRQWRVRALAGTDSGQRYRRVMLAKDLGCLEASVAMIDDKGWRTERGFRVMLRIKAFPVADPFSTGMFGESLDIGAPDISYGGVTGQDRGF